MLPSPPATEHKVQKTEAVLLDDAKTAFEFVNDREDLDLNRLGLGPAGLCPPGIRRR